MLVKELEKARDSLPLLFEEGRLGDLESVLTLMVNVLIKYECGLGHDFAKKSNKEVTPDLLAARATEEKRALDEKTHDDAIAERTHKTEAVSATLQDSVEVETGKGSVEEPQQLQKFFIGDRVADMGAEEITERKEQSHDEKGSEDVKVEHASKAEADSVTLQESVEVQAMKDAVVNESMEEPPQIQQELVEDCVADGGAEEIEEAEKDAIANESMEEPQKIQQDVIGDRIADGGAEDTDTAVHTASEEKAREDRRIMELFCEGFMRALRRKEAERKTAISAKITESVEAAERWVAEDPAYAQREEVPDVEADSSADNQPQSAKDLKELVTEDTVVEAVVEPTVSGEKPTVTEPEPKNGVQNGEQRCAEQIAESMHKNGKGHIEQRCSEDEHPCSADAVLEKHPPEGEIDPPTNPAKPAEPEKVNGETNDAQKCSEAESSKNATSLPDPPKPVKASASAREDREQERVTESEGPKTGKTAAETMPTSIEMVSTESNGTVKKTSFREDKPASNGSKSEGSKSLSKPSPSVKEPASMTVSDQVKAIGEQRTYKVTFSRIVVRSRPNIDASMLGMKRNGALLKGTPYEVQSVPWLKLSEEDTKALETRPAEAWVLIDGTHIGLSKLLEPLQDGDCLLSRWELQKLMDNLKPLMPNLQREDTGPLWVVVGGAGKGGLLVRAGEALDSKPLPSKLIVGSMVEEIESSGNRLHYRRIRGDGPDFGWCNLSLHNKPLLQRFEADDESD